MTRVVLDGGVIADAPRVELITIEGNRYFPPSSVRNEFLVESAPPYACPWKGECRISV